MDIQTKPELNVSQTGARFKILNVTGIKSMQIPLHFSTREAVIIVLLGEAVLRLSKEEIILKATDSAIIPATESHTLKIKEDFKANVITKIYSEIKFIK